MPASARAAGIWQLQTGVSDAVCSMVPEAWGFTGVLKLTLRPKPSFLILRKKKFILFPRWWVCCWHLFNFTQVWGWCSTPWKAREALPREGGGGASDWGLLANDCPGSPMSGLPLVSLPWAVSVTCSSCTAAWLCATGTPHNRNLFLWQTVVKILQGPNVVYFFPSFLWRLSLNTCELHRNDPPQCTSAV